MKFYQIATRLFWASAVCIALVPLVAGASELSLPGGSRQLSNRVSTLDSYALPVAPIDGDMVPAQMFEGRVDRQTWRIDTAGLTTLQLLDPLRAQLIEDGYTTVFECTDLDCGGFDFRFGIEVVPAPDMHVDIRNYRFVAATRGKDEALSLLISASRSAAYIQVIHVGPGQQKSLIIRPRSRPLRAEALQQEPTQQPDGLAQTLATDGHVILADLVFQSGAARLGPGEFASLEQLAAFLLENPGYRIAVVGHTDSVGALGQNISLSKRRAASVRARLTDQHGIAPDRVEAEGMGYLAPVASNLTPAGREANRRVEAILLSQ